MKGRNRQQYIETVEEKKNRRIPISSFSVKEFMGPFLKEGMWLKLIDKKRSLTAVGRKL